MRKNNEIGRMLDEIIKKYRPVIIEKLYREQGYELDKIIYCSNNKYETIFIKYKRKKEVNER